MRGSEPEKQILWKINREVDSAEYKARWVDKESERRKKPSIEKLIVNERKVWEGFRAGAKIPRKRP